MSFERNAANNAIHMKAVSLVDAINEYQSAVSDRWDFSPTLKAQAYYPGNIGVTANSFYCSPTEVSAALGHLQETLEYCGIVSEFHATGIKIDIRNQPDLKASLEKFNQNTKEAIGQSIHKKLDAIQSLVGLDQLSPEYAKTIGQKIQTLTDTLASQQTDNTKTNVEKYTRPPGTVPPSINR